MRPLPSKSMAKRRRDEGIAPRRTPQEMQAAGVAFSATSAGDGSIRELPAALIDLVTPNALTEYRLGYRNFHVITRYNRSSFYAAAVMDLAAALHRSK
jgi:membrane-bound lytic murein transglycosylase B